MLAVALKFGVLILLALRAEGSNRAVTQTNETGVAHSQAKTFSYLGVSVTIPGGLKGFQYRMQNLPKPILRVQDGPYLMDVDSIVNGIKPKAAYSDVRRRLQDLGIEMWGKRHEAIPKITESHLGQGLNIYRDFTKGSLNLRAGYYLGVSAKRPSLVSYMMRLPLGSKNRLRVIAEFELVLASMKVE
jgi:hypothetical protein